MRPFLCIIVAVATVLVFGLYGYGVTPTDKWTPGIRFVESTLSYASLGVGVVLCIGSAVWLLRRVLSARQRFLSAYLSLAGVALVASFVPGVILLLASGVGASHYLFSGDSGGYVLIVTVLMLWIAGITLATFPFFWYALRSAKKA